MKVILQENVANLGKVGDQVNVKAGFARNFLLPHEKAVVATSQNLADFETRRAALEQAAEEKLALAKQRAEAMAKLTINIEALASDEGKLFGSIGPREVADAMLESGCEAIEKREVVMVDGPIRHVGEHNVMLSLHSDVSIELAIHVSAQSAA
ncbi:MAG: 50S ribosomal protein L9 [Coxiellaceae bacterium]|nr:50S ribosomal protein L9 [Coxiellaceae bacterium]